MGEGKDGGEHGNPPLTPTLSHQGRGDNWDYFLRSPNEQEFLSFWKMGLLKLTEVKHEMV